MSRYKIADLVFEMNTVYDYSHTYCKDYYYNGEKPTQFIITTTQEDILAERQKSQVDAPDAYLESLALFRKFCDNALEISNTIVFHSSALMVDGEAFLFTAPSGTGKSTHANNWRKLLGEKVTMINDDKPLVRFVDGAFYVYGSPWQGKHDLGNNCRAKIKAICKLEQAKENKIAPCAVNEMLLTVLNQTVRPSDLSKMDKTLKIIERLLNEVKLYKLGCNTELQAAEVSYNAMRKGGKNED